MKNTSILIPIILIACLLALAYLITQAFQDGKVTSTTGSGNDRIVLNPADYSDDPAPADIGTGTNTDGTLDDYFQEADDRDYTSTAVAPPATTTTTTTTRPVTTSSGTTSAGTTTDGRYLVIAGSFRQLANAQERVSDLKQAGFRDSRLERFNRGTFAVALAGQRNSYRSATALAEDIRRKGFEARVMRRR